MQRSPPRRTFIPTSATRASYYAEGRRALALAQARHPDLCALEALVRAQETIPDPTTRILRPATTRRYLEDHRIIVAVLTRAYRRAGFACDQREALERIEAALRLRRGRPVAPRTASLKVKDASELEAECAFRRLKKTALRHRSRTAAAVGFYVVVVPRLGMRPVELCGATVEGHLLHLPNAKRANQQSAERILDLSAFPESFIAATRLLTMLAPERADVRGFKRWRNTLAASLFRACATAGTRRLSLYSFRHVALATWEAAGYTAAEIAVLAGHLSLDTAAKHYARARAGWANPVLPHALKDVYGEVIGSVKDAEPHPPAQADDVSLDDLPRPEPSPKPLRVPAIGASAIATWFDALQARDRNQAYRSLKDRSSESEPNDGFDRDSAPMHRREDEAKP